VELRLYNYEEVLSVVPSVAKGIQLAQVAATGSRPYILEDGPEFPRVSSPHADPGGEVLDGMYAERCTSIDQSRIHAS
jgi:hypothetical protein